MLERVLRRGQTSGRVDDNEETFGWRYKSHMIRIAHIAEAFAGKIVDV